VTEPDPVATLAQQVEDLRASVARYQAIVTAWNARLEREGVGGTLMLRHELKQLTQKLDAEIARFGAEARSETEAEIREELKKLRQKLDEVIAKRQGADLPAPYWLGLPKDEYAAQLAVLRQWIEHIARVQWPTYMTKLPPCWEAHPEAHWELANLMTEWTRIYGADSPDLAAAMWYFERWLPGCLNRIAGASKCDVAGCRAVRSQPWERSPPPRYT